MKKVLLLLMITTLVITTACKKKNKEEELPEVNTVSPESITISGNSADVTVTDIWDTVLYVPSSVNSEINFKLDINTDGIPDFNIIYRNIGQNNNLHSSTKMAIEPFNNNSYVLSNSGYPKRVFHKDTLVQEIVLDSLYPKVVSENEVIHKTDNWKSQKLTILYNYDTYSFPSGNMNPVLTSSTVESGWYKTDKKYIGIKYKDRLGWIKIGVQTDRITIYEYALGKE